MLQQKVRDGVARGAWWRVPARALLLGLAAAAAGWLFGTACGGLLCLAHGTAWGVALWWGARGAFAGLVAGAIIGAISGFHHVEGPAALPDPARSGESPRAEAPLLPARPAAAFHRNGVRPRV